MDLFTKQYLQLIGSKGDIRINCDDENDEIDVHILAHSAAVSRRRRRCPTMTIESDIPREGSAWPMTTQIPC